MHSHKIEDKGRFARLVKMGSESGLHVEHRGTKYVRGWPTASQRPYHIYRDGKLLGAFGALASLEAGLQRLASRSE